MKIIYSILRHLIPLEPVDNDPLANMSLRERADLPPWHEEASDAPTKSRDASSS